MSRIYDLLMIFVDVFQDPVWVAPGVLLLIGLVGGAIAALVLTGQRDGSTLDAETERQDLEKRRDSVIAAIRALDLERDKLSPEDYEREKRALLEHGAEAMRALEGAVQDDEQAELMAAIEASREQLGEERAKAITALVQGGPLPKPQPTGLRLESRLALISLGSVLLLGVLALVLVGLQERPEPAPVAATAPSSGGGGQTAAQQPPESPEEQALQARLDKDANDLEALNGLTDFAIRRQLWDKATDYNTRALALDAKSSEGRVWHALLVYREGNFPQAVQELEAVIADAPDYPRAHQFRGMVHLQLRQFDEALAKFQTALELTEDPAAKASIQRLIGDTRQAMQAARPEIGGTITLGEGVDPAAWGSQAQVYVSVKATTGPPMPLRAKRFPAGPFPLEFNLSSMDAPMRGGPLPESVSVTVKVDLDGNPMGDDPGAPKIVIEGVKPGSLDMQIVLGG